MTAQKSPSKTASLGPVAGPILDTLHQAGRRVLLLPEDWALVDGVTHERSRSRVAIHRLAKSGWLRPIRRGAWAVRSESGTVRLSALGLVGALTRGPHLVTAGQALAFHRLSDQSFREIVVVVPNAQRSWSWLGTRVRYVRMPVAEIWGGREHRFGELKTVIASPERAVLDSLAHPRWGVALSQVAEAIDRATRRDDAFVERLALAAAQYDNAMLARRLGFLVERLRSPEEARAFLALRGATHASAALLPRTDADTSEQDSRWRVAENVPFELLTGHREIG
jgi:predicted transcriptional regulator of viral defense system